MDPENRTTGRGITPLMYAVMNNRHGAVRALLEHGANVAVVQRILDIPVETMSTMIPQYPIDDKTRALLQRHLSGRSKVEHVCSLPECEARRLISYDEKKLKVCPCGTGTYYCCVEHQRLDYKRHRPECKAAREAAGK